MRWHQNQGTQTDEQLYEIVDEFLRKDWSALTRAIPPIVLRQESNGDWVAEVGSRANYAVFFYDLRNTQRPVTRQKLESIVIELERSKMMQYPKSAPVAEPIAPAKNAREIANEANNKRIAFQKLMDTSGDSPIRGRAGKDQNDKPKASQEDILKAALDHQAEQQALANIRKLIANHSASSASAADAGKKILTERFDKEQATGKKYVEIADIILSEKERVRGMNSQELIREAWSQVAKTKGVDLTKKSPNTLFKREDY